jgi:lipopolysaccharide transport system permease protein
VISQPRSVETESAPVSAFSRRATHTRDLITSLVARDFHARYRDSMLGIVWAVVNPLAQLLTFHFLFQQVLSLNIRRYSSFAFIGLIAWGWFSTTINQSVRVLKTGRDVIEQPGFPAPILPFVSVTTNMLNFLIALPILAIIIALEGSPLHFTLVTLPVIMVIQFAFILGFAYLLAGINAAFRDTQHILVVALQLYFFLTPIFYDLDSIPERYRPFFNFNPMMHLVQAYRAVMMHGAMPDPKPLLYVFLFSVAMIAVGMRVYTWARYRYLEEL